MRRLAAICAALALLLLLPGPPPRMPCSSRPRPERGGSVERAPGRVMFRFNEPVESAFGALRVFDARGERVDVGATEHPGGEGEAVAVGAAPGSARRELHSHLPRRLGGLPPGFRRIRLHGRRGRRRARGLGRRT